MTNQNIETPNNFFQAVQTVINVKFEYDLAASAENAKCKKYFTIEDDSLSFEWPKAWCWLNPPFSKLDLFVKACQKNMEHGSKIVSIWPASTDLNLIPAWKNAKVYLIFRRIWTTVRGCMVCVWDRDLKRSDLQVSGVLWEKKEGILVKIF